MRPATAVCFSGLRVGDRAPDDADDDGPVLAYAEFVTHGCDVCGEIGVGGGSSGPSAAETEGERRESGPGESMSGVDESSSSASSSQESATGAAAAALLELCCFFLDEVPAWELAMAVVTVGRGMSFTGLWAIWRSRRDDCSSEVAAAEADIWARGERREGVSWWVGWID